jgi:ABC-type uncharacterized transport system permease subunit
MDRLLLVAAALCFLVGFGTTHFALGAGRFRPGRFNFLSLLAAFGFLSGFLYLRGQAERSCPLNSLFDVLVFLSWSLVLIYLVIGPTYRLSLLGAFTAPLALVLLLVALVSPIDTSVRVRDVINPWVEAHAALSIIAYGAFGLAGVAGVMYLVQDRQLKSHKASALLYNLPPITDLAIANRRLIVLGLVLLTVAFASGVMSGLPVNPIKFWFSAAIWIVYSVMLVARQWSPIGPRRFAESSVVVFALALIALPAIQYLSTRP